MEDIVCSCGGTQPQIRLVTEEELTPAGLAPPLNERLPTQGPARNAALQRLEAEEDADEQGEESAKEEDPIVEFAPEPDAETEPSANGCNAAQHD